MASYFFFPFFNCYCCCFWCQSFPFAIRDEFFFVLFFFVVNYLQVHGEVLSFSFFFLLLSELLQVRQQLICFFPFLCFFLVLSCYKFRVE